MEQAPDDPGEALDRMKQAFGDQLLANQTFYDLIDQQIARHGHAFHALHPEELNYEPTYIPVEDGGVHVGIHLSAHRLVSQPWPANRPLQTELHDHMNIATISPRQRGIHLDPHLLDTVRGLQDPKLPPYNRWEATRVRADSVFMSWQQAWNSLIQALGDQIALDPIHHTVQLRSPDPPYLDSSGMAAAE